MVYPTPSYQFSRPHTTTVNNLPLHLQQAMADIHTAVSCTTTYSDHYSDHSSETSGPSMDRIGQQTGSEKPHPSGNCENSKVKYPVLYESSLFSGAIGHGLTGVPPNGGRTQGNRLQAAPQAKPSSRLSRNSNTTEVAPSDPLTAGISNMSEQQATCCYGDLPTNITTVNKERFPDVPKRTSAPTTADPYHSSASLAVLTPMDRVMSKAYKLPLIKQKPLHNHTAATEDPATPPNGTLPTSAAPDVTLTGPSLCSSSHALSVGVRQPGDHNGTPACPTAHDHGVASIRPVQERWSRADITRHFTSNFQKHYHSPDMRRVIVKEGKRHQFWGHSCYDFH